MVEGVIDNAIASRINTQLRERLTPTQFRLALETLFAERDDILVDLLEGYYTAYPGLPETMSEFMLNLLIPKDQHTDMFRGNLPEGDPNDRPREARRIVRLKLIRHLRKEKGISRAEASRAVNALTVEELNRAIGPIPVSGFGDWLKAVWDYISTHWIQILGVLLPIVLLLL